MNSDRVSVEEVSQIEALGIVKGLMNRYPVEKDDSTAIMFTTLENALVLMLISLENNVRAKDVMRPFTKNVLAKVRNTKDAIRNHVDDEDDEDE